MNPHPAGDADEEIAALIATLHETGQRLELLTADEVDSVSNAAGRTFLLQSAQESLRHIEAAKQAVVLNALPAHIALLDAQGVIASVNEAWRQFGAANAVQGPGHRVGVDYLAICDQARGKDAAEARQAAAGLELELTESLFMTDLTQNIATLQAIRALGVIVAIDDFGTGFYSLGSLAKLPMDALKIDRSFVVDMTLSSQGLALVSTIITLAHSLELKVVAEGVETEEQSRLLHLLGCDEMQGYLFSKPLPAEIFEARFLAPGVSAAV